MRKTKTYDIISNASNNPIKFLLAFLSQFLKKIIPGNCQVQNLWRNAVRYLIGFLMPFLVLTLVLSDIAQAENTDGSSLQKIIEKAKDFQKREEYEKAFELYEQAVKKGSAEAAFLQSKICLANLPGIGLDKKKGAELLIKAAEMGDSEAQYRLGLAYSKINPKEENDVFYMIYPNFEKSCEKARHWFEKSAARQNAGGEFGLCFLYTGEECVKKDIVKAAGYCKKSANKNFAPALLMMATLYKQGEGVEKNLDKAIALYEKAASQEESFKIKNMAIKIFGHIFFDGEEIARDLEKSEIYFDRLAKRDDAEAMTMLGNIYLELGNHKKAKEWFEEATKKNNGEALNTLGLMYLYGENGIRKNCLKAKSLIEKSVKQGYDGAALSLPVMYSKCEDDFGEDEERDFKLWLKAANKDFLMAKIMVGIYYHYGAGVKQSKRESKRWIKSACEDPGADENIRDLCKELPGKLEKESFLNKLSGFLH